jgi:hypothetical protein
MLKVVGWDKVLDHFFPAHDRVFEDPQFSP